MASAGSWVGNIIALPFAGFLCVSGFNGGWPSIFYIFGGFCIVWSVIFMLIASDRPDTHRFITEKEKNYIIEHTNSIVHKNKQVLLN